MHQCPIVSRINILQKRCADLNVESTYRAIIDQKITRAKNFEQQQGDNDREVERIKGLVAAEMAKSALLQQELKNLELKTKTQGESEGGQIKSFFDSLGEMPLSDKMFIWKELQRNQRITAVTQNVKTLIVKPEDVDFLMNDSSLTLNK